MSQETRDKMKESLEIIFNAIVDKEDMDRMGRRSDDFHPEITSLTGVIQAYAKLEAIDKQEEAVQAIVNALHKKSMPIDWKN